MDVQAKYLIIKTLIQTEDDAILNQVKELLGVTEQDWRYEISEAEKVSIMNGVDQLNRGEGIPHEEVMKKARARFFKK